MAACMRFSDQDISRDEFIFYSKRLMRLLIEFALSMLPFKVSCLDVENLQMSTLFD